jgi:hypothetical protein
VGGCRHFRPGACADTRSSPSGDGWIAALAGPSPTKRQLLWHRYPVSGLGPKLNETRLTGLIFYALYITRQWDFFYIFLF